MSVVDPENTVLHEVDVEKVIQSEIEATVGKTGLAIADVASPGAAYVQAEAVAVRDALNSVLAVLRTNGIIAP